MAENKWTALTGSGNKRLHSKDLRDNQATFPLADVAKRDKYSGMTIPSEEDVIHAKKWVDNGSRL